MHGQASIAAQRSKTRSEVESLFHAFQSFFTVSDEMKLYCICAARQNDENFPARVCHAARCKTLGLKVGVLSFYHDCIYSFISGQGSECRTYLLFSWL